MNDHPKSDSADSAQSLEERVARLERQMAVLMKARKTVSQPTGRRDFGDRYDALEYPER